MSYKSVTDLGTSAYLMMHEFKVAGRQMKSIYFDVAHEKEKRFDELSMDYLASEFHRFDSCIMSLKKMGEYHNTGKGSHKHVFDLGMGAYLMMHKYRPIGRFGKAFYFEVPDDELNNFDRLSMEYLSSDYHQFDSCLMSLKKMPEYMPEQT